MAGERRLGYFEPDKIEQEKRRGNIWRTIEELAEAADVPEELITKDIKEKRLYAMFASARHTPLLPAEFYDNYWIPSKEFQRAVEFYVGSKNLPPIGSGGVYEEKPKDELWEKVANQKPLASKPGIRYLVEENPGLLPYEGFLNHVSNGMKISARKYKIVERYRKDIAWKRRWTKKN